MKYLVALAVLGVILAAASFSTEVEADHGAVRCGGTGEKACILLTTSFVEKVMKGQEAYTYCINPAGQSYPGFVSQVKSVTADHVNDFGITASYVPYPSNPTDRSCRVRHDMLWDHACPTCGAWIFLQNDPMVIEYNQKLGYTYLQSTIGHELGHGECLLDEHYDKVGFRSFINTFKYWIHGQPTVMDSGTYTVFPPYGIFWYTEYDLENCRKTLGLSTVDPCPLGPVNADGLRWDSCNSKWSGTTWDYHIGSALGTGWFDKKGNSEWGVWVYYDDFSRARYNHRTAEWSGEFHEVKHCTYNPATNGPWRC